MTWCPFKKAIVNVESILTIIIILKLAGGWKIPTQIWTMRAAIKNRTFVNLLYCIFISISKVSIFQT